METGSKTQSPDRPPAPPHNIGTWPTHWARVRPQALAVADEDRRLDWATFEERISALAGRLATAGVEPGDRVAVLLSNQTPFLEAFFATVRVGAIFLPLNLRLSTREIAVQLKDARPEALLYDAPLQEVVTESVLQAEHSPSHLWAVGGDNDPYEDALRAASPQSELLEVLADAPAMMMYTSGTTGQPKGALLSHGKSLYNSLNAQAYFENSCQDRVLVVAPLFHSLGLNILALPIVHAGGAMVLHRHFDAVRVWDTVERERITYIGGVPTMYQRLAKTIHDEPAGRWSWADLRFAFTAGSAVSVQLIHTFRQLGIPLQQGYGQTETSILTCLSAAEALEQAGSVGRPVLHGEVRVVERTEFPRDPEHWRPVAQGEIGEVVVRGPITMLGYWERPDATADVLIHDWLCTGDLATQNAEGYITLAGRKTDMFISGGENVYPAEVEGAYREHPWIREIAVVGVPHEEWGEVGRAYVVLEPGRELESEALDAWGRQQLASFKVPREYRMREELPRTASGKIRKYRLLNSD